MDQYDCSMNKSKEDLNYSSSRFNKISDIIGIYNKFIFKSY